MLATVTLHIQNAFSGVLGDSPRKGDTKSRNTALLGAAVLLAVLPFELEHLLTMFAGAFVYFAFYALQPSVKKREKNAAARMNCSKLSSVYERPERDTRPVQRKAQQHACIEPRSETRTCTVSPVVAPTFQGSTWAEEVEELLVQITPTAECERTVAQLTRVVKKAIWSTFPDAEVMGFASANLQSGKAFGVAVPDVDIVANVSPKALMQRMQKRSRGRVGDPDHLDSRQLQKYAIRLCTERLVSSTNLKFRRSAFRGDEPKVTLLAPAAFGFSDISVPMDLSVNSLTPLHNAALFTECGRIDSRARALILLVKRWAKDRGVCHAAKGHLSPYAWTLLVIYFLQVGVEEEGPLLPPLSGFEVSSGLVAKRNEANSCKTWARAPRANADKTVAELLIAFFRFYADFDWRNEAISVGAGKRAPPSLSLPLHIMDDDGGRGTEVGPSIEDPFAAKGNLSSGMTVLSFARLREELQRADQICVRSESLSVLLEPWVPPEMQPNASPCDQEQAEIDNED